MNEVEKMYENAGFIKKQCKDYSCTVCEQYNDGKGMSYIVKNCPAYRAGMNLPHYCKAVGCCINTYVDGMDCTTVTDCVIKQVIEIAKDIIEKDCYENSDVKAEKILQLFDIEEIGE